MSRTIVRCLLAAALCTAGIAHAGAGLPETPFHGGQALALRGLLAADSVETNLSFVNLAQTGNRCTLALETADGIRIGPVVTLTLGPLENRSFPNVFEKMTAPGQLTETRALVSCEGEFSAAAELVDGATGRRGRVAPEELAADEDAARALALPVKAADCPVGAQCLDAPGLVFVPGPPPGPPLPVGRVSFPAPAGAAKRFVLSIDVTVADWYPKEPSGKHLIYWFVINKNIDMPGLLYFRGPGKDQAFARHGINLTHPEKVKIIKPFKAKVGHTYHVVNDYNMTARTYTVTITDTTPGGEGVVLTGRTNVATYNTKANSKYLVDMGFYPGKVDTEVPSYGWKYSNVHIETYK